MKIKQVQIGKNMPLYKWTGINLVGLIDEGVAFAKSEQQLSQKLFSKKISVLSCDIQKETVFNRVPKSGISHILNQLAELLNAEIRLYQALSIIKNEIKNKYLYNIVENIAEDIQEGLTLSAAINQYDFFDELTKAVIISGEKTGKLKQSMLLLIEHKNAMQKFSRDIKSSLTMPLVTLFLFILIAIGLVIFVVPTFENLYQSLKEPLPNITVVILNISNTLRSPAFILSLIALATSLSLIYKFIEYKFKYNKDKILLNIPFIGDFLLLLYHAKFLNLMSLMLTSKIHISDSLKISSSLFSNLFIGSEINKVYDSINSGKLFSEAIKNSVFNSRKLYDLIKIGESSGDLVNVIMHSSKIYQQKVYKYITYLTIFVGPTLIILTGLLVGILILALYVPILMLSNAIS